MASGTLTMLLRVASVTLLLLYISRHASSFHFSSSPNSRHFYHSIIDKPQSKFIKLVAARDFDVCQTSSSSKTLFPSPRHKSYHRSKHFVSISADDEPRRNKALMRRIYNNSVGRLFKLLLFVLKVLVLKPLSALKSIVFPKETIDTKNGLQGKEEVKLEISKSLKQGENDVQIADTITPLDSASIEVKKQDLVEQESQEVGTKETASLIEEEQKVLVSTNGKMEIPYFLEEVEEKQLDQLISNIDTSKTDSMASKPTNESFSSFNVDKDSLPKGERWAIAAPGVDLTARWKIIVDNDFKESYDKYLKGLGQPSLVRSVAVSIVEMTTEEIIQENEGRELCIKGKNLRGLWERTLVASGSDHEKHHDGLEHLQVPIVTADKEKVVAEAWWENEGKTHFSILKGVKKYGGGDFQSKRYLESDGDVLVCESMFIPNGSGKEIPSITWRFKRTT